MVSNGSRFTSDMWEKTCKCIQDIFTATGPYELLTWKPDQNTVGPHTPDTTPLRSPSRVPPTLDLLFYFIFSVLSYCVCVCVFLGVVYVLCVLERLPFAWNFRVGFLGQMEQFISSGKKTGQNSVQMVKNRFFGTNGKRPLC